MWRNRRSNRAVMFFPVRDVSGNLAITSDIPHVPSARVVGRFHHVLYGIVMTRPPSHARSVERGIGVYDHLGSRLQSL